MIMRSDRPAGRQAKGAYAPLSYLELYPLRVIVIYCISIQLQETQIMGFPSPAADYTEKPLSLDALCIHKPHATYFMRAGQAYLRAGIQKGATLVVDASVKPFDGSIVIVALGGEFVVKRLRLHPAPVLMPVDYAGTPVPIDLDDMDENNATRIFGVMTYCVNDMRTGEFDDTPYGIDG